MHMPDHREPPPRSPGGDSTSDLERALLGLGVTHRNAPGGLRPRRITPELRHHGSKELGGRGVCLGENFVTVVRPRHRHGLPVDVQHRLRVGVQSRDRRQRVGEALVRHAALDFPLAAPALLARQHQHPLESPRHLLVEAEVLFDDEAKESGKRHAPLGNKLLLPRCKLLGLLRQVFSEGLEEWNGICLSDEVDEHGGDVRGAEPESLARAQHSPEVLGALVPGHGLRDDVQSLEHHARGAEWQRGNDPALHQEDHVHLLQRLLGGVQVVVPHREDKMPQPVHGHCLEPEKAQEIVHRECVHGLAHVVLHVRGLVGRQLGLIDAHDHAHHLD
mmetsp:Transcript_56078/g.177693  ORF Transcript_56078/g.177693 Transcript_56078/m.177693 type:complete len:332 (+) Transcript_56078:33-1028(+)